MMAPGVEGEEFHLPLCLSQLPSAQVHLYLSQGSMIESPQTRDGPYHLHLHGTCERRQAWKIFPAVVVAAAAAVVVVAHSLTPFRVQTSLFEPQPQPQPNPALDLPLGLSSQDLDSPPPHATMQRERDLRAGKQERERGRRSSSFWSCSSAQVRRQVTLLRVFSRPFSAPYQGPKLKVRVMRRGVCVV